MVSRKATGLLLRLRSLLFRRRAERELDEELRFHFDHQVAENLAAGMNRAEAESSARRLIGGDTQIRDQCRDARGLSFLADTVQDLRYALRGFRRSPGFALAAVFTLALGVGANITVFSIADTLLLKLLPVKEPDRLIQILQPEVLTSNYFDQFSFVNYQAMQREAGSLLEFLAERPAQTTALSIEGGSAENVRRSAVSGNYFHVLGVSPVLGRMIEPNTDAEPGRHAEAVLNYGYWRRRFHADPAVIGRTIRVGNKPFEIIGVAEPGFFGLQIGSMTDVWTPVSMEPERLLHLQGATFLRLFGRLKPGVTSAQVLLPLQAAYHRQQVDNLRNAPSGTPRAILERVAQLKLKTVSAAKGASPLRKDYGEPVAILFAVVAVVLLMGCGNVANLLLARASARQREMAVRVSLGAGRPRLMRQLLTESLLLAMIAAAAGLAVARWTVPVLVSMLAPSDRPIQLSAGLDFRVVVFTIAISALTAAAFGIFPALRASRANVHDALKGGTRLAPPRENRWLLVGQMALSLALLLASSLLVRTLVNLQNLDPGFDRHNLLIARVEYNGKGNNDEIRAAWADLLRSVSAIPEVESASLSGGGPFAGAMGTFAILTTGTTTDLNPNWLIPISANYFETLGGRIVAGRDFEPRDLQPHALPVAILNETAARRHFGNQNAVGQKISDFEQSPPQWTEVVGVAADMKFDSLRTVTPPIVYLPLNQGLAAEATFASLELRARRDSGSMATALRRSLGARFAVRDVQPLNTAIDNTLIRERLLATVGSFFGVLALLLAGIGLYGSISYSVTRRTQEIGVRIALGARPSQILAMVAGEALVVVAAGAVLGAAGGVVAARAMSGLLFGVQPHDARTVAISMVLLAVTAAAAALVPAIRACRTDPVNTLRSE